jgi:hypothetical protein
MNLDAPCDISGKRNETNGPIPAIPKLKANFPIVLAMAGHSVSAIGHYTSGFEDDATPTAADLARGQTLGGEIPAVFTLDLQYGFTLPDVIGKELSLKVGMINAFDKMPPLVNALATFAGEVHDPRGRMFYGKLEAEF